MFDNDISILLKKAKELNIPAKYVIISNSSQPRNSIAEILTIIPTGITLPNLQLKFPSINSRDLGILYAKTEGVSQINLEKVNSFFLENKIEKINDTIELKLLIADWLKKFKEEFDMDMQKLENIEILQKELAKYPSVVYSPIQIDSTIVFAKVEKVEDVFDKSKPKKVLPYIRYNNNDSKEIFKLYTGKNLEERPDYSKIIPNIGSREAINTISFSVWKGDLEKDNIKEATKESYLKGSYSFDNDLMKIKIPLKDDDFCNTKNLKGDNLKGDMKEGNERDKILKRISDSFPFKYTSISENTISGELYFFDVDINDILLSDMVLNYELLNTYLFMKEMSSSYASKKKQLKLFFRSSGSQQEKTEDDFISPSSVAFSITQNYAKGGEVVNVAGNKTINLTGNLPYIRVKISSADSIEVAESFVKIFSRLLSYYKEKKNELERLYISYIPDFLSHKEEITNIDKKIGKEADSKIARLKAAAPDVFVTDYARKCLCPFQPIPISDDEIQAWEQKTFINKGKTLKRQVLRFPPDNPKYNFVCPEDTYPFPGVKKNTLSNKDKYLIKLPASQEWAVVFL